MNLLRVNAFVFIAILMMCLTQTVNAQTLPTESDSVFIGSGHCQICHTASAGVLQTSDGIDISPPTTWRSSMMANASKDPFWRAQVAAESEDHPTLKAAIEDKCINCHAPSGYTIDHITGDGMFSLTEMEADNISMDGVTCTVCHQIQADNFGLDESFSGNFQINNQRNIYGPYADPDTTLMRSVGNYLAVESSHIEQSELCATCHTLFMAYVDGDGNLTGSFPEQVPYWEWKNSIYPDLGTTCQTCHIPAVDIATKISITPANIQDRQPVFKHDFVGANTIIPEILKNNSAELGVTAESAHFDSTNAKALNMLQENAVELTAVFEVLNDTLNLDVKIQNNAGHKFPTGFPSRRAWLHIYVTGVSDQMIFSSGEWDIYYEIINPDKDYEPHHDLITMPDQVQIYQSVMKDYKDDVTYSLLRAAGYLKDNRIPPKGFVSSHTRYEDMKVTGGAELDEDFNKDLLDMEGN